MRTARVIAKGTPEDVARVKKSYTGQYLKGVLGLKDGVKNGAKTRRRKRA